MGVRESVLGGSGVAARDSSAPSYYNPALLSEKSKNYFNVSAATFSYYRNQSDSGNFSSTKINPNYISTVQAFDSFVQEFSLTNEFSISSRFLTSTFHQNRTTSLNIDLYQFVYAFAFPDFPFGFKVGVKALDTDSQVSQVTEEGSVKSGASLNTSKLEGALFLGVGSVFQLAKHYRLGVQYEMAGIRIYQKFENDGFVYYYDQNNNTFYQSRFVDTPQEKSFYGQNLNIGHSFGWEDHEFLTDSKFVEVSKDAYNYIQTFGYNYIASDKWQFMCGYARQFKSSSQLLEDSSDYYSSGFSWVKNTMRSSVGAYYVRQKQDKTVGITFGSEFKY
ncbi:MAG: hypothetical protein ACK41T_07935 [Pseudobdellovibrio sp.]